jgi:superfamily II DNA/RNA helicase
MFAPTQDWTEALATAEEKLKLPFKMRPFQEKTARALFNGQDVILVSYTGSGKTVISPVTSLTKRSQPNKGKGVLLHLLPLNELIKEKTTKSELRAGYILIGGQARMQSEPGEGEGEESASVTSTSASGTSNRATSTSYLLTPRACPAQRGPRY